MFFNVNRRKNRRDFSSCQDRGGQPKEPQPNERQSVGNQDRWLARSGFGPSRGLSGRAATANRKRENAPAAGYRCRLVTGRGLSLRFYRVQKENPPFVPSAIIFPASGFIGPYPLASGPVFVSCKPRPPRGVSPVATGDQRRCLWNPPPFEKGGPKLYLARLQACAFIHAEAPLQPPRSVV